MKNEGLTVSFYFERAINAREALAAFKKIKNLHWEHLIA